MVPKRLSVSVLVLVLSLLGSRVAAQSTPKEPPRFRILSTRLVSTMRSELATASRQGYRVLAAIPARPGYLGMALLLERNPASGEQAEYRLIAETDRFRAEQQIHQAATDGFHVIRPATLVKPWYGLSLDSFLCSVLTEATTDKHSPNYQAEMAECEPTEMVVVMERSAQDAATTCQHRYALKLEVPSALREVFWLRAAVAPGEDLVASLWDGSLWTLAHTYGERLPIPWKNPPEPCSGTPAAERIPSPDYRILVVRDFYALARKLGQETARGGVLIAASSYAVSGFAVAFQQDAVRVPRLYEAIVAEKKLALRKQLDNAAARGFRVVPWTLLTNLHNHSALILESRPDAARYEYLLVNGSNEQALERAIQQTGNEYRPVALANWKGLTAILERPARTLPVDGPVP